MLCPIPLFPGCKKPVSVAIRTVNGKSGEHVVLDAGDIPLDAADRTRTVRDEFRDIRGLVGSAGSLKGVEDYLYEADFTHLDATGAETHFRERFADGAAPAPFGFGCSVVRLGDRVGRAYDWKYDEAVTFVVRTPSDGTRFASVAVCSSPAGVTRQTVESLSVPGSIWSVLPFYATDGMNEHGVTCSVCVVRAKGDESVLWRGREFCAVGAVRQVLDRARTAQEGADIIASGAWMPAPDKLGGYSLHFMITDASHTFVVEDGVVIDITDDDAKAMTNFRLGSRSFLDEAGFADVNRIASYDPFGTGVERYNDLVTYARFSSQAIGMREWLTGFKYSDAYVSTLPGGTTARPSDFAGTEISGDRFAKVNETEAIRAWFVSARVREKWLDRARDGKFWQTVHSAVYDTEARTVSVVVQEGSEVHEFSLARSGGGEGTVKSVNGVRPGLGTGDVALSAQDIPYGGGSASNVETAVELNTQATIDNTEAIDSLEEQVGEIKTTTYTKSEVDDKINQSAAHYLTADAEGSAFATVDALKNAETYYYAGEVHKPGDKPDKNDYAVVLNDGGKTARWAFFGEGESGVWQRQYYINETTLTQEQWKAVDSGITAELLAQLARKSDIPITSADIEDYENYRGHFDLAALYMKDDIVRAVKSSTGEVAYFRSLANGNRGVNPFTEGQNRWERTEDDEGLDKLSMFVKAAIAGMTGADIPVSPTNSDKIDVALGKVETIYLKYDGTNIKRDDTVLTSFSALLNLVRTGRVILEANATPSLASSLALFRPQLNNANAILFDATGEINGVIETRNINVKRKGTDGIEVVSGGLNALAKKSDIPDVSGKRDKSDMYTEWVLEDLVDMVGQPTMAWDEAHMFVQYTWSDVDGNEYKSEWVGVEVLSVRISRSGGSWLPMSRKLILSSSTGYEALDRTSVATEIAPSQDNKLVKVSQLRAKVSELEQDIEDSTKLTPVYTAWRVYNKDGVYQPEMDMVWVAGDPGYWRIRGGFGRAPGTESSTHLVFDGPNESWIGWTATRTLDHYLTAKGEKILAGDTVGVFATPAFKTCVATALDEQGAKDKITTLAEAAIKNKAMPTEGAVEGSVAARIVALESGGGGGMKYDATTGEYYQMVEVPDEEI